jgi:hypothetical protein
LRRYTALIERGEGRGEGGGMANIREHHTVIAFNMADLTALSVSSAGDNPL